MKLTRAALAFAAGESIAAFGDLRISEIGELPQAGYVIEEGEGADDRRQRRDTRDGGSAFEDAAVGSDDVHLVHQVGVGDFRQTFEIFGLLKIAEVDLVAREPLQLFSSVGANPAIAVVEHRPLRTHKKSMGPSLALGQTCIHTQI